MVPRPVNGSLRFHPTSGGGEGPSRPIHLQDVGAVRSQMTDRAVADRRAIDERQLAEPFELLDETVAGEVAAGAPETLGEDLGGGQRGELGGQVLGRERSRGAELAVGGRRTARQGRKRHEDPAVEGGRGREERWVRRGAR